MTAMPVAMSIGAASASLNRTGSATRHSIWLSGRCQHLLLPTPPNVGWQPAPRALMWRRMRSDWLVEGAIKVLRACRWRLCSAKAARALGSWTKTVRRRAFRRSRMGPATQRPRWRSSSARIPIANTPRHHLRAFTGSGTTVFSSLAMRVGRPAVSGREHGRDGSICCSNSHNRSLLCAGPLMQHPREGLAA